MRDIFQLLLQSTPFLRVTVPDVFVDLGILDSGVIRVVGFEWESGNKSGRFGFLSG